MTKMRPRTPQANRSRLSFFGLSAWIRGKWVGCRLWFDGRLLIPSTS